jgi:hypothetical protein
VTSCAQYNKELGYLQFQITEFMPFLGVETLRKIGLRSSSNYLFEFEKILTGNCKTLFIGSTGPNK